MWALIVVAIAFAALSIYLACRYYNLYSAVGKVAELDAIIGQQKKEEQEKKQSLQKIKEEIGELNKSYKKLSDDRVTLLNDFVAQKDDLESVKVALATTKTENDFLIKDYENKKVLLEKEYRELCDSYKLKQKMEEEKFNSTIDNLNTLIDEQHSILMIALEQNRINNLDNCRGMLNVPEIDRIEITELVDVCRHLRNGLPVCKAIYDIYYKVPLTNMVNDLGVRGICGIYKITNVVDGKMYIGQSVDIGERWRQHIKRGCGAEVGTISGSKLYSAMMNDGLWNFKFELLQECAKEELGKYEKYWINYFNSIVYGYNMKAGG